MTSSRTIETVEARPAYWSRCGLCGASVALTTNPYSGVTVAVDWQPDPAGDLGVRDERGRLWSRQLRRGDHLRDGELGATPHAGSCVSRRAAEVGL
jgi:hypothetical protein